MPSLSNCYGGLDLGMRRDPSAFAIVERLDYAPAWQSTRFHSLRVRHLERLPLGTPYPGVVARVREVMHQDYLFGNCPAAVDATGVGIPVVDMLRAAQLGSEITAVTITGGDHEHRLSGVSQAWSVPKRDLLAALQVALDNGELRIAKDLKQLGSLVRELTAMQAATGSAKQGEHDDLVIALALACWRAKRPRNSFGTQRLL